MLERKRLLKIKEQIIRDGQRVFIYEQPGTGDVFTIIDPALQLNQLEQVQHDVAHLLEHGLNPPEPPPPTDAQAAAATASDVPAPDGRARDPSRARSAGNLLNGLPPLERPPHACRHPIRGTPSPAGLRLPQSGPAAARPDAPFGRPRAGRQPPNQPAARVPGRRRPPARAHARAV